MKRFLSLLFVIQALLCAQAQQGHTFYAGINLNELPDKTNQGIQKSSCDTIRAFETIGIPSGLTFDGADLWYVSTEMLYKITTEGQLLDSIPNPNYEVQQSVVNGGGLDFDGTHLWLVHEGFGVVRKINVATKAVEAVFELPSINDDDPNVYGIAIGNGAIWVSDYISRELFKLDPQDLSIIEVLSFYRGLVDLEFYQGELYSMGMPLVPATTEELNVYKVNTENEALIDSIPWCVSVALGFDINEDYLWNASGPSYATGTESVYKVEFDASTLSVSSYEETIDLRFYPNPTSDKIYIQSNKEIVEVFVYDMTGRRIQAIFEKDAIDLSYTPRGIYLLQPTYEDGTVGRQEKVLKY